MGNITNSDRTSKERDIRVDAKIMTPFLGVCFLYRGASPRNTIVRVALRTVFVERRRKRHIPLTVFCLHFNFFCMCGQGR